jgi:RNase H-fold protein (predicted Holliday junction resolvase)
MLSEQKRNIIGVDPGTGKIGLAVLDASGDVITKAIFRRDEWSDECLGRILREYTPFTLVIGNGTGMENIRKIITTLVNESFEIKIIEEKGSSEQARKEFLMSLSPLKRTIFIIGQIIGTVRFEIDDHVAVILARRYFDNISSN